MEEPQDLPEQPVKKAKMQESRDQSLSHVSSTEVSDQKTESSNLGSNLPMSSEIMTCTDYIPRSSNDYTSQMYSTKPYAHILSVPVSETMSPYPAQPQYQALQQSQPYTIYPQTTQTYGLPPFEGICYFGPSVQLELQTGDSGVAPIIKERMMKKGSMMLGYQPHRGKVNFFRQVVISPQVSREDMDFLLDEIELLAKDL